MTLEDGLARGSLIKKRHIFILSRIQPALIRGSCALAGR